MTIKLAVILVIDTNSHLFNQIHKIVIYYHLHESVIQCPTNPGRS